MSKISEQLFVVRTLKCNEHSFKTLGINPLAALIAPLAGLALLGAAAAVSINPVLVQLAVINGGRKKRDTNSKKMSEIDVLESFLTTETNFNDQAENMVASYLECSGLQLNKVHTSFWLIIQLFDFDSM